MSKTFSGSYTDVTLTNASYNPVTVTGTITGTLSALEGAGPTFWTITNAGTITGSSTVSTAGVKLDAGGIVRNQAAGTISGNGGVAIGKGGTVENAGSIGGIAYAVYLQAGYTNQVIFDPGATFTGTVNGGNTIGAAQTSTLLLASAAGTGALSGLGSQFINFAQVTVEAGASWTLASGDSVGKGVTLSNSGSLTGPLVLIGGASFSNASGAYLGGTAQAIYAPASAVAVTITNDGSIAISGTSGTAIGLQSGAAISNAGVIIGANVGVDVSGAATVINQGSIGATATGSDGVNLRGGGTLSNTSIGTITGNGFAVYIGNGGTMLNDGTVMIGTTTGSDGLAFSAGGVLVNTKSAYIAGHYAAVGFNSAAATITNDGTILAVNGSALAVNKGGSLTNQQDGTIAGRDYGIELQGGLGTVSNQGHLTGNNNQGAALFAGGSVTNDATGVITGYGGVLIAGGAGTVTNKGSIGATGNFGVRFTAGYNNRLIVDGGATFTKQVEGGNTIGAAQTSTLELSSDTGAGTISSLGTQFADFAQISIDSGANWTLINSNSLAVGATLTNSGTLILDSATLADAGGLVNNGAIVLEPSTLTAASLLGSGAITLAADSTLTAQGTVATDQTIDLVGGTLQLGAAPGFSGLIDGFDPGETIDLLGINDPTSADLLPGNTLQISLSAGGPIDLRLDPTQDFSGKFFYATSNGTDTALTEGTIPCYLAGTLILTDRGEVPVEELAIGDRVVTLSGEAKPIKWIGRRSYASAFVQGNRDVIPICIAAGALDDGLPRRDLFVSPLHAMYLDGMLVPAECLVNGVSIVRCPDVDPIRYFHIELEQHDVIYAEGAPAETFVDCDSRLMFHNAAEFAALYPGDAAPHWVFCAPRVESGPALDRWRQMLEARAGLALRGPETPCGPLLGYLDGVTDGSIFGWAFEPDRAATPVTLEVLADGGVIARVEANRYRADLEAGGFGDGRHGFELRLNAGLSPMERHEIRVRRLADGKELDGSPLVLGARRGRMLQPENLATAIEAAARDAAAPTELDALLAAVLTGADRVRQERAERGTVRPAHRLLSWERGRNERPRRALIIDDVVPRTARDAGSHAVLSHVQALRALGWQVDFVPALALKADPQDLSALEALGVACHAAPRVGSVEEVLRRQRDRFDLVYLHRLSNAEAYAGLARAWQRRAHIVYSVADLHHVRLARQAQVQACVEVQAEARRTQWRELAAMRHCDAVVTHSPAEADYLARMAPELAVFVVPWALQPQPCRVPFADRAGVAFIGGYRHAPNPDAARWLVETIMPRVWQQAPDMPCLIVGSDWPRHLSWLTDRRVRRLGAVERLDEVFDTVRLTVAPMRFGAGIKGKVLDSLAAGVPCVMSPVAAEGIPLPPALQALVAGDAAGIASLICRLHAESALYDAAAHAGLGMIEATFAAPQITAALQQAVAKQRLPVVDACPPTALRSSKLA